MSGNRTTELLPCPFCGGKAFVNTTKWQNALGDVDYSAHAKCPVCGNIHRNFGDTEEEAIEKAIEAWNTRYERTCKQEERGWGTEGDHARVWLTCGHDCMVETVQDLPNYCPHCGAKVVDA